MEQKISIRRGVALFRQVGKSGWAGSGHFTYTYKYPGLRQWLLARLPPGHIILAVGCGTGELEKDLARRQCNVISIDILSEMLQAAARNGITNLVQADAHALPFASANFDIVLMPESIGYLDVDAAFQEAARVLNRQGHLLITTYPLHLNAHSAYRKRSLDEVSQSLSKAGFFIVDHRFLTPAQTEVKEIASEHRCSLVYILAVRQGA
jgi:SAM-dependent methyltransferase